MSAEAEGLQIPVSFTLDEAKATLADLERHSRETGKRIGSGVGRPAEQAAGSFHKMRESSNRAREGMMFLTSSLSEFGPAGLTAQRALAGVGGMLLGGGALLMGLEAARLAVTLVADALSATSREMEAIEKRTKEIADGAKARVKSLREEILRLREGEIGLARERYRQERAALSDEIRRLDQEQRAGLMAPWRRVAIQQELAYLRQRRDELGKTFAAEVKGIRERDKVRAESEGKAGGSTSPGARAAEEASATSRVLASVRRDFESYSQWAAATQVEITRASLGEIARIEYDYGQQIAKAREYQDEYTAGLLENAKASAIAAVAARDKEKAEREAADERARRDRVRLSAESLSAAGGDFGRAAALESLEAQGAQRRALLDEMLRLELISTEDAELARTRITREQSEERIKILQGETDATRQAMQQIAGASARALAGDMVRALGAVTRSSRAYEQAMAQATGTAVLGADLSAAAFGSLVQSTLASLGEEYAVRAIGELAKGIAATAIGSPSAGAHFAAAAQFGAAAAAAGIGASVIGQNRGMTRSERASVESARQGQIASSDSGAREVGGTADARQGATIIVNFSGRALVTQSEVKRELADLLGEARDSGWVN